MSLHWRSQCMLQMLPKNVTSQHADDNVMKAVSANLLERYTSKMLSDEAAEGNNEAKTSSSSIPDKTAHIVPLKSIVSGQYALKDVGGKALRLGELIVATESSMSTLDTKDNKANTMVTVPDGAVLPCNLYLAQIATLELNDTQQIFTESGTVDEKALTIAREKIAQSSLSQVTLSALSNWLSTLPPNVTLAVRSSATIEDGVDFSMAGIAETFLHVEPNQEAVNKAVTHCWASLWQPRVLSYLHTCSLKKQTPMVVPHMAVVLQIMIPSSISGVLFTLDPTTGNENTMLIEAVYGLGEGLVSGEITPHSATIDWNNYDKLEATTVTQLQKYARSTTDEDVNRVSLVNTSETEQTQQPLTDTLLQSLVTIGIKIASFYGHPQDIEFAVYEGVVYVTQTRPITKYTLVYHGANPFEQESWYSGFTYKEWLAMSICSQTAYYYSQIEGMGPQESVKFADQASASTAIFGIAYVSAGILKYGKFNKKPKEFQQGDGMMLWTRTRDFLAHYYDKIEPFFWSLYHTLPTHDGRELSKVLHAVVEERLEEAYHSFRCGSMAKHFLNRLEAYVFRINEELEKKGVDESEKLQIPNLIDGARLETGLAGREIVLLASQLLLKCVTTTASVDEKKDAKAVLDLLSDGSKSAVLRVQTLLSMAQEANTVALWMRESLNAFMFKFFFMCDADECIQNTRYYDDPALALSTLRVELINRQDLSAEELTADITGVKEELARTKERRANLDEKNDPVIASVADFFTRHSDIIGNPKFVEHAMRNLTEVRRYLFYKEEIHECYSRLNFFFHVMLERLGNIWTSQGILQTSSDIYCFEYHGFQTTLLEYSESGKVESPASMQALATMRSHQLLRAMYVNFERPSVIRSNAPLKLVRQISGGLTERAMQGKGCAPGIVTARARVIMSLAEADQVQKGEILVVSTTSPGWTPLFSIIAGLVTEKGGILSHGAVVARESDIPAVLQCKKATRKITTGQFITVNGVTGLVTLHGDDEDVQEGRHDKKTVKNGEDGNDNDDDDDDEQIPEGQEKTGSKPGVLGWLSSRFK